MTSSDRASKELWVCHLGTIPYRDALIFQEQIRTRRQAGELPDTLLLLEHPPVYTRGRRAEATDLPFGEEFYRAKGIDVLATDRGGKLTFHAPGQLVGYPIVAIDDVGSYLRTMEAAIVAALSQEGVAARSRHDEGIDYTGVWVGSPASEDQRKIASIGVHVARGVTTHGFAVNVHNDLEPFSWVTACGLPDVAMTSIAAELERATRPQDLAAACASLSCFRKRMAYSFCQAFSRRQRLVSPARLGIDTANPSRRAPRRAPIKTIPTPQAEAVSV
jgi:lipoyl(octanoyl) transferase